MLWNRAPRSTCHASWCGVFNRGGFYFQLCYWYREGWRVNYTTFFYASTLPSIMRLENFCLPVSVMFCCTVRTLFFCAGAQGCDFLEVGRECFFPSLIFRFTWKHKWCRKLMAYCKAVLIGACWSWYHPWWVVSEFVRENMRRSSDRLSLALYKCTEALIQVIALFLDMA